MADNTSKNNRIARNSLFLYIRMLFVLLVGLYTSRVVLNVLGASDFGTSNVVGGFVTLFAFLNATFSSSIQRFYNYEGGKFGEDGFTRVYSTGLRVHIILSIAILILLESFGTWYVNNIMVLPEGRLIAANILYQLTIVNLILVILQIPFCGAIIAKEKMDFYALVNIVDVILKLILINLLPYLSFDKLIAFASIQLTVQIINFVLYVSYAKLQFKCLRWTRDVDKSLLKGMLSFSGWTLIGSFAFMFKGQGVNLVLNSFFGTIINAARGVAYQINSAVMGFSSNLTMSFRPQLVQSYAEGNTKRTYSLFSSQSRLCFVMTLMLITPIILEMNFLLGIWLGNAVPDYTNIFASLVLIDAMVNTFNAPVTQVVFATGAIKSYQIWSSLVNIILIPICWFFLKIGFEAWIVFLLTIFVSVLCQIVCLMIMHRIFPFNYREYICHTVMPCITMTILVPILPVAITHFMHDSLLRLFLVSLSSLLITIILLFSYFLNDSEKRFVHNYIQRHIKSDTHTTDN